MKNIISCLCAGGISQFLYERLQANIFSKLGGGNTIGEAMVLDLMGLPLQYSTASYYPVSQAAHTTCNLIDFPFYQPLLENTHLALSNYTDVSGLHLLSHKVALNQLGIGLKAI